MKTRKEMIEYFVPSEMIYFKESLEKKSDEEIKEIYDRYIIDEEIKKDIVENGITTFRICYHEGQKEIVDYMKQNKIYCFYDGKINWDGHIGNYCILGIPEKFITEIENKFSNYIYTVDLKKTILCRNDINKLNVGDKVRFSIEGSWCDFNSKGTVYNITGDKVIVKLYRSKSKGCGLKVGEVGSIEKIKTFQVA